MTHHEQCVKYHLSTDTMQHVTHVQQYSSINITAACHSQVAVDGDTGTHKHTLAQNEAYAWFNSPALQYGSPGTAVCVRMV